MLLVSCNSPRWREADARLARASQAERRAGFQPRSGPYNTFGSFADSLHQLWTIALDSGTTYVLGAACTRGCDALAVKVLAPGTNISLPLDADSTPGFAAVARFTAKETGAHTALLRGTCAQGARCWWIVQVYQKGASGHLVQALDPGRTRH